MPTATTPEPLIARQCEVYEHIWDRTCRDGFQPSVRELLDHFGIRGPKAIVDHLRAMERKGWLRRTDKQNRSLRFLFTPDGRKFRGFRPIED